MLTRANWMRRLQMKWSFKMRSTEPLLRVEILDYLTMMIPFPRIGATLTWMGSRLMMVMTVTRCTIKLRSKVDNCFTIRSNCNMQLRNGLSWKRNHSRWLFLIQPHMMSSAYPLDVHGGFMVTYRRGEQLCGLDRHWALVPAFKNYCEAYKHDS